MLFFSHFLFHRCCDNIKNDEILSKSSKKHHPLTSRKWKSDEFLTNLFFSHLKIESSKKSKKERFLAFFWMFRARIPPPKSAIWGGILARHLKKKVTFLTFLLISKQKWKSKKQWFQKTSFSFTATCRLEFLPWHVFFSIFFKNSFKQVWVGQFD